MRINSIIIGWIAISSLALGVGCSRLGFEAPSALPGDSSPGEIPLQAPIITLSPLGPLAGSSSAIITFAVTSAAPSVHDFLVDVSQDNGINWSPVGTVPGAVGPLNGQEFSFVWEPVPTWNTHEVRIRIQTTDSLGNAGSALSPVFVIDSLPPQITANTFTVNLGSPVVYKRIQTVALQGSDNLTDISDFCVKYNKSTQPTSSDGCWVSVESSPLNLARSPTMAFTAFPFTIPPVGGTYSYFVWLRDAVGNVSQLSNSGTGTAGLDFASNLYTPKAPATLTNVWATSTDSPSSPFSDPDLTAGLGTDVYIKWKATDDSPLPGNTISLYFTTDETNYSLIAGGLSNAPGAGCTINLIEHTGCYRWVNGSPTDGYFRVRVTAADADLNISATSTVPLNVTSTFRVLAGNTDPGTNSTASAAMFLNYVASSGNMSDVQSFAVARDGTLYFRDISRGILRVKPDTGTQELLIRTTGTASGDNGPITAATLEGPSKMILDYQGDLLVYDGTRIRKINLSLATPTISTIIGGGESKADGVMPIDVQLDNFSAVQSPSVASKPFFATPNGDLYFSSESRSKGVPFRLRILNAATGLVQSLPLSGAGYNGGTEDMTTCEKLDVAATFDPATSALTSLTALNFVETGQTGCDFSTYFFAPTNYNPITGVTATPHPPHIVGTGTPDRNTRRFVSLNGEHFVVSREKAKILRYDETANDFITLVGTGTTGSCPDGTLATSCNIDPFDAYQTLDGTLYFVDRCAIRIVHTDGKVYTIMGQRPSFGDGGNALSARVGLILDMGIWDIAGSKALIFLDTLEKQMREFVFGQDIHLVAGNGTAADFADGSLAVTAPLPNRGSPSDDFEVDASGNVYYNDTDQVMKLDRATGLWGTYLGVASGGTPYVGADGMNGVTLVNMKPGTGYFNPAVVASSATGLFVALGNMSTDSEQMVKFYGYGARGQTAAMGYAAAIPTELVSSWCGDGLLSTTCFSPPPGYSAFVYDSFNNRLVINSQTTNSRFGFVPLDGTTPTTSVDAGGAGPAGRKFDYYRDVPNTIEKIYFCTTSGDLKKIDLKNANTLSVISLPPTIKCSMSGGGVKFLEDRNSLLFVFSQNGLLGIGERLNP